MDWSDQMMNSESETPAPRRISQAAYDVFRRSKNKPLRPVAQIGEAERAVLERAAPPPRKRGRGK